MGVFLIEFVDVAQKMRAITAVDLYGNEIGDDGCAAVAKALAVRVIMITSSFFSDQ